MCGISGGNNPIWDYEAGIESIRHRGPDNREILTVQSMTLAFARLAIIDLNENAMQPMLSEDQNYAIVFNGEIYDYEKRRTELESKGYRFRTKSDTEVLLHAFMEWREKAVNHIDGIFAFAVLDLRKQLLYLFRDRAGVKPLYYFYDGMQFAFASELKAIAAMCTTENFVSDNTALYDFHTYLYIPEPKTMFKNVYKLCPASFLVFDCRSNRIIRNRRYWKPMVNVWEGEPVSSRRRADLEEELRTHLHRAVKRQLVADVPVGSFLSGGVDSSIITCIMKEISKENKAFCIGFTDRKFDESGFARDIARLLQVPIETEQFRLGDFKTLLPDLKSLFDEPFADTSAFPTKRVAELAKRHVTVVLTGDGGDEVFGGYGRCTRAANLARQKRVNCRSISALYLMLTECMGYSRENWDMKWKEDAALIASWYWFGKRMDRQQLRKKFHIPMDYDDFWHIRKYDRKDLPPITRMRYLDYMTYLPGDILTKVDRATMSVALEARVPFLDQEVVEFAFSLTQEECNPSGELKGLLKSAFSHKIPLTKMNRPKMGFSMPHQYLNERMSPQEYLLREIWNL